jgi:enoyl-CoA hydratase
MSVRVQHDGPVFTIILDRHEVRNAVDRAHADALSAAVKAFEAHDDARVAVLYGAGGTFCAGADLKAISRGEGNRLEPDGPGPMGPTRSRPTKPVIAAIRGHAVAGGLELALWCDLRVAATDATLGVFCRRWGVPLIDGGTVRLPRLIGMGRALDLILTGRPVLAPEALRIGLVDRVVEPDAVLEEATALARQIASYPTACLRTDRASAYQAFDAPLSQSLRREFEAGVSVLDEAIEGAGRFADGAGRHGQFDPIKRR